MKSVLCALVSLLLLSPGVAGAQSVIFVMDAGPAQLDTDVLRERIAEDAEREVLRMSDEASREATETLTIAWGGQGRWILRYQRGTYSAWSELSRIAPNALARSITDAAVELLRTESPGAVPAPNEGTRVAESTDDPHGTGPGHDLVDPFSIRWDPLRVAIDGELMRPFIARRGMIYHGVTDPFSEGGPVHLLDPWQ